MTMTTKMWKPINSSYNMFLVCVLLECEGIRGRGIGGVKPSVSSLLIFGDSTVDAGNNNHLVTPFKSNFSPYGKDFTNHTPTGRFSNGRLPNDFLDQLLTTIDTENLAMHTSSFNAAAYVGLKESVPAYLDPSLSLEDLVTGVTFASAGSGFDPLTPSMSNVMRLSDQLGYFKEYRGKLEAGIGKEKTKKVISNAVFIVSAGTNDFVTNYFAMPIRRRSYTIRSYMGFVMKGSRQFLQELLDQGARRIAVVGLPPMGCLPVVITFLSSNPILQRNCIANLSSVARDYNQILQKELKSMQLQVQASGARIVYLDSYSPLEEIISGHRYGFDVVSSGCCGTGLVESAFFCNFESAVCEDATKYVFWDSIHPTERVYELLFKAFLPSLDYLLAK